MSKKLLQAAAGAGGEALYVEDVFSTYLYTGNGSTQSITNGIDLDGEGGLVWMKARNNSGTYGRNVLMDTERVNGSNDYILYTDGTDAQAVGTADLTTYNSDGFTINAGYSGWNGYGYNYASWTFRKAEKFFDVVTYTGNGTAGRQISHNLGSVPGCIIIKRIDSGEEWAIYHRSLGTGYYLRLTTSSAFATSMVSATDVTNFTLTNNPYVNDATGTYVAYLFAHDAGGFGDDDESIIKCGSYTGNNSADGPTVTLGWEPQWLLIKESSASGNAWSLYDMMRNGTMDQHLRPNASDAEATAAASPEVLPQATGFKLNTSSGRVNRSQTYIYIAIRRPMKTPESGTDVFGVNSYSETTDYQQLTTGNLVDFGWQFLNGDGVKFFTRLLGKGYQIPSSGGIANTSTLTEWDYMDGFAPYYANGVSGFSPRQVLGFTRASGFFDVVAWDGDGTSNRDINHNLGVTPELIIVKSRTNTDDWFVYLGSPFGSYEGDYMLLNSTGIPTSTNIANIFPSAPTSTTFRVGNERGLNGSGEKLIAYLLASVDGVSKIGTYNGSSSNVDITLGFAPRLFIVKKLDTGTSGAAHWIMWNSALGIVAGNDPRVRISSGAYYASNDCIDPIANGIRVLTGVNGNWNEAGSEYSYIAIA